MPPMVIWDCQSLSPELTIEEMPGTIYGLAKKGGLTMNYLMCGLIITFCVMLQLQGQFYLC